MTPEQAQTLVGREFVHFKGNRYRLVAIAKHSETLEPIVVYRALYGEGGVWVRPFEMFFGDVDRDGYRGPRFRLADAGAAGAAPGGAAAADASDPERTLPSPAGQSWFLVWVVVSIRPRSFWRRCLRLGAAEVWIDQLLVSAPDAAAAYDKALAQERRCEDDPPDADGRRLWSRRFTVLGARDLLPVYEDVADGAELSFERIPFCWFPRRLVHSRAWCAARDE
jgi:hypothetical protein